MRRAMFGVSRVWSSCVLKLLIAGAELDVRGGGTWWEAF